MTILKKTLQFRQIRQKHSVLNFKNSGIGSSETTREAPYQECKAFHFRNLRFKFFGYKRKIQLLALLEKAKAKSLDSFNFDNFKQIAPTHVQKKLQTHFLEWFIGFAEGDGSFYIKRPSGKSTKLRLIFEVGQKDPKVLYLIKKQLGFGTVNSFHRDGEEYFVYRLSSKQNIQRIIHLFNGNLVLTKRKVQFYLWLRAAYRLKCLPPDFKNKIFSRYVHISEKTAWCSGFIDAEGCFYATFSTPGQGSKMQKTIRQKMTLTQKHIYDETAILECIGKIFKSKSKVQQIYNKRKSSYSNTYNTPYRRLEISSVESHLLIINYLKKFPLHTDKHINSLRWGRLVRACVAKDHLNPLRLNSLSRLANSINASTTKKA